MHGLMNKRVKFVGCMTVIFFPAASCSQGLWQRQNLCWQCQPVHHMTGCAMPLWPVPCCKHCTLRHRSLTARSHRLRDTCLSWWGTGFYTIKVTDRQTSEKGIGHGRRERSSYVGLANGFVCVTLWVKKLCT